MKLKTPPAERDPVAFFVAEQLGDTRIFNSGVDVSGLTFNWVKGFANTHVTIFSWSDAPTSLTERHS